MDSVSLTFHWRTKDEKQSEVRLNADFILAAMIAGGVDFCVAKTAVEKLFDAGWSEGYEDGVSTFGDQEAGVRLL